MKLISLKRITRFSDRSRLVQLSVLVLISSLIASFHALRAGTQDMHFVILGDRTGEAQPGVYQQIWRDTAAENPDFVINAGDTIQGENDATVDSEWRNVEVLLRPYKRFLFLYTPGNHDVWDDLSAKQYEHYTHRALHYSFDRGEVHISVLDNSRTEDLPASELDWLDSDLAAHRTSALKLVFSHRPSWVLNTVLQNPKFRLQQIAEQYGVCCVFAGHIHEMMHFELNGVTYVSLPSAGGHLRNSKQYKDGWFFAHTLATVHDGKLSFLIKETRAPFGEARQTVPADWGAAGLIMAKH